MRDQMWRGVVLVGMFAGVVGAEPLAVKKPVVQGPCTKAAAECLGYFSPKGATWRLPYYRSYPIDKANDDITLVVVVVHGISRTANHYFNDVSEAVAASHGQLHTLVVAPHFQALVGASGKPCTKGGMDSPSNGDLIWHCESWVDGENASGIAARAAGATGLHEAALEPKAKEADKAIVAKLPPTSFGVLDSLLDDIRARFPHVTRIVVAGHSAGGQFVLRYAAVSRLASTDKLAVRFVPANPSSYLYLDEHRPSAACGAGKCDGNPAHDFVKFHDKTCPGFNDWKYGLDNPTGAASLMSATQLRATYLSRDVRYVLGDLDVGTDELDPDCPAVAEGTFRLQRGQAFMAYLSELFKVKTEAHIVKGCAHEAECIFTSVVGRTQLFGP